MDDALRALGSACLAWLALTGVVYLIGSIGRRRLEHGWLAAQSLLAAVYPMWRLGIAPADALPIALGLASAASVVFTRAHFGLPAPGRSWAILPVLGVVTGMLSFAGWLHFDALAGVTLLIVTAAIAHHVEELWRHARRFNARVLLVGWAALGAGIAIEAALEVPTTIVGLAAFAFLYTVALARQHGLSLEESDRHRRELETRLATIEAKSREIEALNQELRRQIGLRSRQLARALGDAVARPVTIGAGTEIAGRYTVVGHLGSGGMGLVYEVVRKTDGRRFALKLLHGNARGEVLVRFAREAELLAQLHDPNLVGIVDVDVCEGRLFIVMELVDGTSLAVAERDRDLAWRVRVLADIAGGLVAIHGAGIVHRDLKPANVLVARDGRAKIADFGVSSYDPGADPEGSAFLSTIDHLTQTGAIMGTPGYMAPELIRGARAAGFAVDIYAFGVLAHQLLGGRPPTNATARPSLADLAPALPAGLVALVDACLAWEPSVRPSAADVLARLRALPAMPDVAIVTRARAQPTGPTLAAGSAELPTVNAPAPEPVVTAYSAGYPRASSESAPHRTT